MLLHRVISADDAKTRNAWLSPVLGQRHILPILSSLLSRMAEVQDRAVLELVEGVFRRVLPLAARKATADHLTDCLLASIRLLSQITTEPLTDSLERLLTLTIETFVAAFPQTKFDKKKVTTLYPLNMHPLISILTVHAVPCGISPKFACGLVRRTCQT